MAVAVALAGCASPSGEPTTGDDFEPPGGKADIGGVATISHVLPGVPQDMTPDDDHLVARPQYVLSYNRFANEANWVGWRLVQADFGDVPRRDRFSPDSSLPAGFYVVQSDDYTNSGFDRGHILRSEERTRTDDDNAATFLMSNIMPQTASTNRGPWLAFERFCQQKAEREDRELYIVAGPVFAPACTVHSTRPRDDGCRDIGARQRRTERVLVPTHSFKIVLVLEPGQELSDLHADDVVAVMMPNATDDNRATPWTDYVVTVREIEARTGYRFFSALDSTLAEALRDARFNDGSEQSDALRVDPTLLVGCGFDRAACEENADCCSDACVESVCVGRPPPVRPSSWSCEPAYYAAADGCDCECGARDPDCDDPGQILFGCPDGAASCDADGHCVAP